MWKGWEIRFIAIKIILGEKNLNFDKKIGNFVNTHAHKLDWKKSKDKIWNDLKGLLHEILEGEKTIIRDDLDDHATREVTGYKVYAWRFMTGKKIMRKAFLDFTKAYHPS